MADHTAGRQDEIDGIDGIEIDPLSDEALEDVAGGSTNCCSCTQCSTQVPNSPEAE
jgi:hypothetical protein